MVTRKDIINRVFKLVYNRLENQAESLQHYIERWHGSHGGIEGWFKVEFVASIPSKEMKIYTGSAAHGKSTGKKYPDLLLDRKEIETICVELKASTNWSITHGKPLQRYDGWALFFLCGTPANSLDTKRHNLAELGYPFNLDRVCKAFQCIDNKEVDFLFGFLDLGGSKS